MNDLSVVAGMAVAAAMLCVPGAASAQQSATGAARAEVAPAQSAQGGRRAVRDPQTGEFIDGPGETAAPQARTLRPQSAAPAVTRPEEMNDMMLQFMQRTRTQTVPGNTRALSLTPRHLSSTVVVRQADGSLSTECVTGETAAEHRLHAPRVDLQSLRGARDAQ
jgi:hypothetical protein